MAYESNRQRLANYFNTVIYPNIDLYGLEYDKMISSIITELGISRVLVQEYIETLIEAGKLKEIRLLELPKEEIELRRKVKEQEQMKIAEELEVLN